MSVILTIYNGFDLSSAIKYATSLVKHSINSSSFLFIIIIVITICLVKFLAFPFIFPYVLSMFPEKEGMLHASSQAESSTKAGKDPYSDSDSYSDPDPNSDPEPNKDIDMGNSQDSDDRKKHDYPDIVSVKWPEEYFRGSTCGTWSLFNLNPTHVELHVPQVPLGTSPKYIFAKSNTIIKTSELINRIDL